MKTQSNITTRSNEIDLDKLWQILVNRKLTIFITIFLSTLCATSYVVIATPVYSGNVLIEIGEVVNNNQVINNNQMTTIFNLDNVNNLKEIMSSLPQLETEVPVKTNNILKISVEGTDKTIIRSKLKQAVTFVLARHQEKAKLYQNDNAKVRMTQVIREIQITNGPIKPKKGLIIALALITGLILGTFIALFREFIMDSRNDG